MLTRESFNKYYRKQYKAPKRKIRNFKEYKDKGNALTKAISEAISESRGGVYLPKWGYIFNFLIPRKMRRMTSNGKKYNHHTDNRVYMLMFIPDKKATVMRPWVMTKSFNDQV